MKETSAIFLDKGLKVVKKTKIITFYCVRYYYCDNYYHGCKNYVAQRKRDGRLITNIFAKQQLNPVNGSRL